MYAFCCALLRSELSYNAVTCFNECYMFHIHALKNTRTVLSPGRKVLSKTVSLPKKDPLLK